MDDHLIHKLMLPLMILLLRDYIKPVHLILINIPLFYQTIQEIIHLCAQISFILFLIPIPTF